MTTSTASSLTFGFFQSLPIVLPAYTSPQASSKSHSTSTARFEASDDPVISRIISLYLPNPPPSPIVAHLHEFSRQCLSTALLQNTIDADTNSPTLHPLTTFGEANVTSSLRTSSGWRALKAVQIENGVVGHGYPQPPSAAPKSKPTVTHNLRIHQFLALHIWGPASAVTTCPMAMTDGAAVLLRNQLLANSNLSAEARRVFANAYEKLVSNDPAEAWTSGQWMTERSGGSSVAGTETLARRLSQSEVEDDERAGMAKDAHMNRLGEWSISGFKWFSSATDADCVVLLARTPKGLSAFFAPMRRKCGDGSVMNGVTISRLKNKLGTKAVPTAELSIAGMRGWLIGEEGQGVKMISAILNITRLHTACGGVSGWRGGLAASRAFTRVRMVQDGKPLVENVQHMKWMADETVIYRAMTQLYFFGVALLGHSEFEGPRTMAYDMGLLPETKAETDRLLRLLTPVIKFACSLRSVEGLRACMESLGGVGYCENNEDDGVLNIARLFRDANVNPIWEGTGSVMAEDVLRALQIKRKGTAELETVFGKWLMRVLGKVRERSSGKLRKEIRAVEARYLNLKRRLGGKSEEEVVWQGRVVLEHFEAIVCALLLMVDACVDENEIAEEVASRWVRLKVSSGHEEIADWKQEVEMDRRIFLGEIWPGKVEGPALYPKL